MGTLILWGLALIILGLLAIALPYYFAISSVVVLGAILVSSGLFWLFYHLQTKHTGAGGWVKPFISVLIGLLFLLFPERSLIVIGVFLLIYLLIDAFGSFFLAFEYRGRLNSWFFMLLNGIVDIVLAFILIYYIPNPKVLGQIFGLLIGISLLIDGLLVLWFGWRLKVYYDKYGKLLKEE